MDTTEVTIALDTIVVFGAKAELLSCSRLRRSTDHLSSRISGPHLTFDISGKVPAGAVLCWWFRPHGRRTNSAGMAHTAQPSASPAVEGVVRTRSATLGIVVLTVITSETLAPEALSWHQTRS